MTTEPQPTPAPPEPPAPATWLVEATLVVVLVAHVLSALSMRLTAAAMPLFFVDACLFGPLGIGLAIAGAREANRRAPGAGRKRLVALVLLLAASTSLTPCLSGVNLQAGALRDLERAGGAEKVVTEGRALLARWAAEERPPGPISPQEWPTAAALGTHASYHVDSIRVKSFGFGDFAGFVVTPPGAAPVGRPVVDGLSWWSPVEHGSIGR